MKPYRFHEENLAKHGVSVEEAEQCLARGRKRLRMRARRKVYQVIAQTDSGRYLELMYCEGPDYTFVFHAMDARPRQIRLLERKGRRS